MKASRTALVTLWVTILCAVPILVLSVIQDWLVVSGDMGAGLFTRFGEAGVLQGIILPVLFVASLGLLVYAAIKYKSKAFNIPAYTGFGLNALVSLVFIMGASRAELTLTMYPYIALALAIAAIAALLGRVTLERMAVQWDLQLLVIPCIIYIFIFMYLPMYGMLMAFQQFKIGDFPGFSPWVGFQFFDQLFKDPNFMRTIRNTVAMSGLRIVFGFPMPIIFAIMLNEIRMVKFKKVTQTISYLPHFISWVVAATLMFDFLAVENGAVNSVLMSVGFIKEPIYFFGRGDLFWGLATVTDIWKVLGWNAIIYVAAITSIDSELYEAASIDGASRMAKIWHITIAGIKPTIIILFILAMGTMLTSNFDQVWMLTGQMGNAFLREYADVMDTYVLRVGIRELRFSFGAAAGLFRTVVNFALVLIANYVANKTTGSGLF